MSSTTSSLLREEGNAEYRRAVEPGRSPVLVEGGLQRALSKYDAALGAAEEAASGASATEPEARTAAMLDRSSALKNLGRVHERLAQFSAKNSLVLHERATVYFLRAATARAATWMERSEASAQEVAWLAEVEKKAHDGIVAYADASAKLGDSSSMDALHRLLNTLTRLPTAEGATEAARVMSHALGRVGIATARTHFQLAARACESLEYVHAISLLEEGRLALLMHGSADPAQTAESTDLRASIDKHLCIAESCKVRPRAHINRPAPPAKHRCACAASPHGGLRAARPVLQARLEGDAVLERALHGEERLLIEIAWDAADLYRAAVALAREGGDVEAEAVAVAALADLLGSIFLLDDASVSLYSHAHQLGLSLSPRAVQDPWFHKCETVRGPRAHAPIAARFERRSTPPYTSPTARLVCRLWSARRPVSSQLRWRRRRRRAVLRESSSALRKPRSLRSSRRWKRRPPEMYVFSSSTSTLGTRPAQQVALMSARQRSRLRLSTAAC